MLRMHSVHRSVTSHSKILGKKTSGRLLVSLICSNLGSNQSEQNLKLSSDIFLGIGLRSKDETSSFLFINDKYESWIAEKDCGLAQLCAHLL